MVAVMRLNNHSSDLPELALRVEERRPGVFFWVLLAAGDPSHLTDLTEALHYRPYRAAAAPQGVYWDALLLGMAELRRVLADGARSRDAKEQAISRARREM
ncbi:MAG: hypothetical protein ACRYGA_02780 [Janthinobacterium lividum]